MPVLQNREAIADLVIPEMELPTVLIVLNAHMLFPFLLLYRTVLLHDPVFFPFAAPVAQIYKKASQAPGRRHTDKVTDITKSHSRKKIR